MEDGDWSGGGGVRFQYGSADRSTLSRAEGQAGREQLVFSGGVTYQDVNDLRVGGGDELPYTSYSARGGNARVRAQLGDGHELSFQLQSMEQPRTPRFDELVPGFGQATPTSSTFYFEPQVRDFAQLRWRGSNPTRCGTAPKPSSAARRSATTAAAATSAASTRTASATPIPPTASCSRPARRSATRTTWAGAASTTRTKSIPRASAATSTPAPPACARRASPTARPRASGACS